MCGDVQLTSAAVSVSTSHDGMPCGWVRVRGTVVVVRIGRVGRVGRGAPHAQSPFLVLGLNTKLQVWSLVHGEACKMLKVPNGQNLSKAQTCSSRGAPIPLLTPWLSTTQVDSA